MKKFFLFIIILIMLFGFTSCSQKEKTPLIVFAAGSLIQPFKELETAFEAEYPQIDVLSEFHGSIQVMRHVTELHEEIDIVASADQALLPMLMYQVNIPGTETPYADWYISMATNRLAIAFKPESKYANEITADNWWQNLFQAGCQGGTFRPQV